MAIASGSLHLHFQFENSCNNPSCCFVNKDKSDPKLVGVGHDQRSRIRRCWDGFTRRFCCCFRNQEEIDENSHQHPIDQCEEVLIQAFGELTVKTAQHIAQINLERRKANKEPVFKSEIQEIIDQAQYIEENMGELNQMFKRIQEVQKNATPRSHSDRELSGRTTKKLSALPIIKDESQSSEIIEEKDSSEMHTEASASTSKSKAQADESAVQKKYKIKKPLPKKEKPQIVPNLNPTYYQYAASEKRSSAISSKSNSSKGEKKSNKCDESIIEIKVAQEFIREELKRMSYTSELSEDQMRDIVLRVEEDLKNINAESVSRLAIRKLTNLVLSETQFHDVRPKFIDRIDRNTQVALCSRKISDLKELTPREFAAFVEALKKEKKESPLIHDSKEEEIIIEE